MKTISKSMFVRYIVCRAGRFGWANDENFFDLRLGTILDDETDRRLGRAKNNNSKGEDDASKMSAFTRDSVNLKNSCSADFKFTFYSQNASFL